MKPHTRIRKTVKWGGAAMTVLLVAVWVWSVSQRWGASWHFRNHASLSLSAGRLEYSWLPEGGYPPPLGLERFPCIVQAWGFEFQPAMGGWDVCIPIWFVSTLFALASAAAWRFDRIARRRGRVGHCRKCNYNRHGLPADAVCPECGASPDVSASSTAVKPHERASSPTVIEDSSR
jgi:hypothetical protein